MEYEDFSFLTTLNHLKEITKNEKRIIVYTYGVWDLLHPGHIRLLKRAKDLGDILIVGVVNDIPVKKLKGENRPILNQKDRIELVSSFWFVDYVIPQIDYDPTVELKRFFYNNIFISILAKGDDWERIPGAEIVEANGGELVKLPYSKQWSSSRMVEKITGKPAEKFGEPG